MSGTPQHAIQLTHTLQRGHVWELRECELTDEAAGGIRLCMRTSSPGQGGDTYARLYRWLRAQMEEAPPESISLLDLSGLELFDAERLARTLRAGVRRARPEQLRPQPIGLRPHAWDLMRRSDDELTEEQRREKWNAVEKEKLRQQALRLEEHRSTVRPKWWEGERFLALAWRATSERQRFSRAAFLTAWKWMGSQGRASRALALPLVMDGEVTVVGGGRLGLTRCDVEVLAHVRALTFHYLAREELSPPYAKALGKMVKACEKGGLLTPRRYANLDEVRGIPGIAPSALGEEPMSRPRIWESVVAAASEQFLDYPVSDRPQTEQRKCPGGDPQQTPQPQRPGAEREQLTLEL